MTAPHPLGMGAIEGSKTMTSNNARTSRNKTTVEEQQCGKPDENERNQAAPTVLTSCHRRIHSSPISMLVQRMEHKDGWNLASNLEGSKESW